MKVERERSRIRIAGARGTGEGVIYSLTTSAEKNGVRSFIDTWRVSVHCCIARGGLAEIMLGLLLARAGVV
jgi:hypothetical protein